MVRFAMAILGGAAFLVAAGCGSSEPTSSPPPMQSSGPPSGNAVFDANCLKCHSVTAPTAGGKKQGGPNLSKVGTERDAAWLADHVKNPKTHKPGSKMPEFADKLTEEQIKDVAAFMSGLK